MSKPILLSRSSLAVSAFASKDEGRYALTGIHITAKHAEATNGHILMRVPHDDMPAEDFPAVDKANHGKPVPDGFIMPLEAVKNALKALPRKSTIPVLTRALLTGNGAADTAVLTTTDLESSQTATIKGLGGKFPDADKVIASRESRISVCFSATYLKSLADFAIKYGTGRGCVKMFIQRTIKDEPVSDNARIEIDLENGVTAYGVLMPMRPDK